MRCRTWLVVFIGVAGLVTEALGGGGRGEELEGGASSLSDAGERTFGDGSLEYEYHYADNYDSDDDDDDGYSDGFEDDDDGDDGPLLPPQMLPFPDGGGGNRVLTDEVVQVYMLVDGQGETMKYHMPRLRSQLVRIFNGMRRSSPRIRIAVGQYKDMDAPNPWWNMSKFAKEGNTWMSRGRVLWRSSGKLGDVPQAQFYALDQIAEGRRRVYWLADAYKIILWMGISPAHDPICQDQSLLLYNITESTVTQKLIEKDIHIAAVSLGEPGLDADPLQASEKHSALCPQVGGSRGQATRIANATGGKHVFGSGTPGRFGAIEVDEVKEIVLRAYRITLNRAIRAKEGLDRR